MSPAATLKLVLASALAGLAVNDAAALPGDAACKALSQQDAAALMGAPLESNFRNETPADAVNGHDHTTVCGWFPKGFDLKSAGAPPERGVLLTLHTFRTPGE